MTETVTGTVYRLVDPRNDETRYIGATKRPLAKRLDGHLRKTAPRVAAWIAELREAGLRPLIIPIREDVAADELAAAEREEITLIFAAGGTLLNEQATATGRELRRRRRETERAAAEQAGWKELADIALRLLGGPMPPGGLPEIDIPEVSWRFMSTVKPGHAERAMPFPADWHPEEAFDERYRLWRAMEQEREEATRRLQYAAHGAGGSACGAGGDRFADQFDLNVSVVAGTSCASPAEASRHIALITWYMVAVHPWHHLAQLGGLAADDDAFIAWAGRDREVREALEFIAARRERALERLPYRWYSPYEKGPGHLLGAITAAYSGVAPEAVSSHIAEVLAKAADDHELTQPMADLLTRLNPRALDSVFGPDIAAAIDRDLGLTTGTSGSVLRALAEHIRNINDPQVRRAVDRSAQKLPVVALPHYGRWTGPGVIAARVISCSLVRAGLAEPDYTTGEQFMAEVRALWAPEPRRVPGERAA